MLAFLVLACTSGGVAVADHEDSADTAASADSADSTDTEAPPDTEDTSIPPDTEDTSIPPDTEDTEVHAGIESLAPSRMSFMALGVDQRALAYLSGDATNVRASCDQTAASMLRAVEIPSPTLHAGEVMTIGVVVQEVYDPDVATTGLCLIVSDQNFVELWIEVVPEPE